MGSGIVDLHSHDTLDDVGIIPRVLHDIYAKVDERKATISTILKVSFVEIYNEEFYDLLAPKETDRNKRFGKNNRPPGSAGTPVRIVETGKGEVIVVGAEEWEAPTIDVSISALQM